MLDSGLAKLCRVTAKQLNQQVKRNPARFPSDFMFQLTKDEHEVLRSQIVRSKTGRCGRRTPPYAFTEHGAMMLASVLNSQQAVEASIFVVPAFVRDLPLRPICGAGVAHLRVRIPVNVR